MYKLFYLIVLIMFSVFVLIKTISYGLYEIKKENNKIGGICFIVFSIFCILFSNIIIIMN